MAECQPSPKRLKVSEGNEKDDAEQISSPYYLDNLKFILDYVLGSESVDKNALKKEDVSCIQKFRGLEGTLCLSVYSTVCISYGRQMV